MKAIGISSSGRKSAYSKIIVKDILEASEVEYEMIHLAKLNIKGCLGCLKCVEKNLVGGSLVGYPLPTERLVPAR